MTSYLEARFIGEAESGFQGGHAYQLLVEQHWAGKLTVIATHGYLFKPIKDLEYTYGNLTEFLNDWKVIRVVSPGDELE